MSKVCQVTGKKPVVGNNRSHARNATRRRFTPKGMRIIDKKGIDAVLTDIRARGEKV